MDADVVARRGRNVLAHEVGAYRKLAVSPIDEYGKADRTRTAVIDERVHSCPDGPSGEEHVIDEHHDALIHREGYFGLAHDRCVADAGQVVAVKGDVDRTEGYLGALVRSDGVADPRRERVATRANADDGESGEIAITLDDLVRNPRDRTVDLVRAKQRGRPALLPGLAGPVLKGDGANASIDRPPRTLAFHRCGSSSRSPA
jgi:hypothetical protein